MPRLPGGFWIGIGGVAGLAAGLAAGAVAHPADLGLAAIYGVAGGPLGLLAGCAVEGVRHLIADPSEPRPAPTDGPEADYRD